MEPEFRLLLHAILIELQTRNDLSVISHKGQCLCGEVEYNTDHWELGEIDRVLKERDQKYRNMSAMKLTK